MSLLIAALFMFVFGAAGLWLLRARFPNARLLQTCYGAMSLGGLVSAVYAITHVLAFGVAGVALILIGCLVGIIGGVIRKELRIFPPG